MGLAVPVMHYTGMAAASFMPGPMAATPRRAVSISDGRSRRDHGRHRSGAGASPFSRRSSIGVSSLQALQLESSENRYRLLFERSLAGVYRATVDGRMLDVNEACFRMFGYGSRDEHLAHNAADMSALEPGDRDALRRAD